MLIGAQQNKTGRIVGDYQSFSDPSPTATFGRVGRIQAGGGVGGQFKNGRGSFIDILGRYNIEQFTIPQIVTPYLNNTNIEGVVTYSNAFLPETSWIIRGRGGIRQFPTKTINPTDAADSSIALFAPKNDSQYVLLETGLIGRMTENSTVDTAIGWHVRTYTSDYENTSNQQTQEMGTRDFSGPVFYTRFTEQITRRDQLLLGYDYSVADAYITNFVLQQELYMGVVRVLGDQVLFLFRIAYDYNSYSLPSRRDDERLVGSAMIKYSLSPMVKVTADVKVDLLSSDAYSLAPATYVDFNPDRPASYKAGSVGLGLVASF